MNEMNGKDSKPLVYLRALEMEDLEFLYEVENDRSLWGVGCTNVPYSRQMLIDYITSASADIYADRQMRLIIENGQHETVGMVDLINFDPRHLRAEIGIVIRDEVRGKGYAQEAIRQLLVYSKEILHLHQLYAIVSTKNEKAVKMLHSVGFEGSKMLKEWLFEGDFYVDAYLFQCFL